MLCSPSWSSSGLGALSCPRTLRAALQNVMEALTRSCQSGADRRYLLAWCGSPPPPLFLRFWQLETCFALLWLCAASSGETVDVMVFTGDCGALDLLCRCSFSLVSYWAWIATIAR